MLRNFISANPTKLFFGDEAQKNLAKALMPFGKSVTPDMLYGIAVSTITLTGGYKTLDHAEIVGILCNRL